MATSQGRQSLVEILKARRTVEPATPKYLRVYREEVPTPPSCDVASLPAWREICRSFLETTGCLLRFLPGNQPSSPEDIPVLPPEGQTRGGGQTPFGHLRLDFTQNVPRRLEPDHPVVRMAQGIAEILGELLATRLALWQREADLAAGIPLIPHPEEDQHLAQRLEEILHSAAKVVEGHAACVYLLDEATTHLKLRAAWGLPKAKLLAPPRPLNTALADLEAMLGHAVALENSAQLARWNPPENFPAAICLPVSTPTTILGTLWVFSQDQRNFCERDVDLLEVTAGRVAAELERETALQVALQSAQLRKQVEEAQRLLRSQLPTVSPMLEGWELAGWMDTDRLGGAFFDWCCPKDGRIHFAVGETGEDNLAATLTASSVRTAWRSHSQYQPDVKKLLEQLNLTLWTSSAGDQAATLLCGNIDPKSATLRLASAGTMHAVLITEKQHRIVPPSGTMLGLDPESTYTPVRWKFPENAILVVATRALREAKDANQRPLWETQILPRLTAGLGHSAKQLAQEVQQITEDSNVGGRGGIPAILIVKRRKEVRPV